MKHFGLSKKFNGSFRQSSPFGFAIIFALLLFQSGSALANVAEIYGYGSRSAALAGAEVAWGFDGYAATANPAGLSLRSPEHPDQRLLLSWSLIDMIPDFLPIQNVVVENEYTTDKTATRSADVDVSYRETFGQVFGLSYVMFPDSGRLSIGFTAFLPINQLAFFDSGEAFQPEYVLYRSRTQRPQFDLALGAELTPGFHFGIGMHIGYGLTANGSVFLQSTLNEPSSLRIGASLKPKVSPYFGFLGILGNTLSLGAVVRLPLQTTNSITLKSGLQTIGNVAALDINFIGVSALYYDPLSIEMGGSWKYFDSARLYLQVDYQAWKNFKTPALSIESPTTDNCQGSGCSAGIRISPSQNPTFAFKDILVARVGHEWTLEWVTLRAGYAYRPSILKDLPTGAGNYLDPPKHLYNIGAGFHFDHFLHFQAPCTVDIHGSYDKLVTQQITKTPGDESGNLAKTKIGAPGYEAGGKIYGGGISLTLAF